MRNNSDQTQTFSAAFDDSKFDERPYIKEVLKAYGGTSHYTFPKPENLLEDFDDFIYHHDEPPCVSSQYAAWCVMRLAREHSVPVLLNGQGGDELLTGYWSAYYVYLGQMLRTNPLKAMKHYAGALLPGGNSQLIPQIVPHYKQYNHRKKRNSRKLLRKHLQKRGYTLDQNWAVQAQKLNPVECKLKEIRWIHLPRLLKWDDRNSTAFSIEGRYPILDYRLVELAVRLPAEHNLKGGWNKYLIRQGLGHTLPIE